MYFHFPEYERRAQERKRVKQVASGMVHDAQEDGSGKEPPIDAVQIIPPLMQLYPEVEVRHADDASDLVERAQQGMFTWLFAGKTVYLICPASQTDRALDQEQQAPYSSSMRIVHSPHVAPLLRHYLDSNGSSSSQ